LNGKEIDLVEEMKRLKVPFLGITETKKRGKGRKVLHNGSILLYSGVDPNERAKAGVACLVDNDYVNFIRNWSLTNERMMSVITEEPGSSKSVILIIVYGSNEDELLEINLLKPSGNFTYGHV
jgi:hypothetical protein